MTAMLRAEDPSAILRSWMTESAVLRGTVLFRQGDAGDRLCRLATGRVKLCCAGPGGREVIVGLRGPGDLFGEVSLFDRGPRTATAIALTDATVLSVDYQDLWPRLDARPDVAAVLLRETAHRLRSTSTDLAYWQTSDVPGRLARSLLEFADRYGVARADGSVHVPHGLSQEELALLVGSHRSTVNKVLSRFAGRGWIRLEDRGVYLLDVEYLARRAR